MGQKFHDPKESDDVEEESDEDEVQKPVINVKLWRSGQAKERWKIPAPDAILPGHRRAHRWVLARTPTVRGPTSRSVSSGSSTQAKSCFDNFRCFFLEALLHCRYCLVAFRCVALILYLTFCGGCRCADVVLLLLCHSLLLCRCCCVAAVVLSFVFRGEFFGFVGRRITTELSIKDVFIDLERRLGDSKH